MKKHKKIIFGIMHFSPDSIYLLHLTNLLQKPDLCNLPGTRFWLLLVNNWLCSIPVSWTTPDIKIMPGESCVKTLKIPISIDFTTCKLKDFSTGLVSKKAIYQKLTPVKVNVILILNSLNKKIIVWPLPLKQMWKPNPN